MRGNLYLQEEKEEKEEMERRRENGEGGNCSLYISFFSPHFLAAMLPGCQAATGCDSLSK